MKIIEKIRFHLFNYLLESGILVEHNFVTMSDYNRTKRIIDHYEILTNRYYCSSCDIYSTSISSLQMAKNAIVEVNNDKHERDMMNVLLGYTYHKHCNKCNAILKLDYSE